MIAALALFPRQFVAILTAASVLLCGIVCACGSSLPDFGGGAVGVATSPVAATRSSSHSTHCHGHRDSGPGSQDADHGRTPQPSKGKGGDHSCSHCQSAVTATIEKATSTADLSPLLHPADILLPALFFTPAVTAGLVRWPAVGDPSPPPDPTLLSLHCALNT
jgi:hypothetical protein